MLLLLIQKRPIKLPNLLICIHSHIHHFDCLQSHLLQKKKSCETENESGSHNCGDNSEHCSNQCVAAGSASWLPASSLGQSSTLRTAHLWTASIRVASLRAAWSIRPASCIRSACPWRPALRTTASHASSSQSKHGLLGSCEPQRCLRLSTSSLRLPRPPAARPDAPDRSAQLSHNRHRIEHFTKSIWLDCAISSKFAIFTFKI